MAAHRQRILTIYFAALWLVCVYRAATQSIVHDEALTWELYLNGPASNMFNLFDANHHFLNTLLMRISTSIFGFSELAMRLPALAGAALYFAAVYRICTSELETVVASWLAAALLTLNPFILDFMAAARGYGMSLALFLWAIALVLPFLRDPKRDSPRELWLAGAALGLSITANLTLAVPSVIAIVLIAFMRRPPKSEPEFEMAVASARGKKAKKLAVKGREETIPHFWRHLLLPFAAIVLVFFMTAPLDQATSAHFYVGAESIGQSLHNLADVSLNHGGPLRELAASRDAADTIAGFIIAPISLIAALIIGWMRRNVLLLLIGGLGVASALVLMALHFIRDLPYPVDRTGIYFILLASLAMAALADLPDRAALIVVATALLIAIQFALEFNTKKFLLWEYDADTRTIVDRMNQMYARKPAGSVRVGCPWVFEPALNFYRSTRGLAWMAQVNRQDLAPGFDVYLISADHRAFITQQGLKPIYEGKTSGATLAIP